MPARLAGTREPAFRPNRADPRKVAHVTFDPLRPQLLTAAATRLRTQAAAPAASARSRLGAGIAGLVVTALALAGVLAVSDAPFRNPVPTEAEFVFSFTAHGEWLDATTAAAVDPAVDKRPVHMRTAQPVKRTRQPVTVRLEVGGQTVEHTFAPKGLKSDGASVGEVRVPLPPGKHRVAITVNTGVATQSWQQEVEVRERYQRVLFYEPGHGFRLEP
jgi:hypothetical protein